MNHQQILFHQQILPNPQVIHSDTSESPVHNKAHEFHSDFFFLFAFDGNLFVGKNENAVGCSDELLNNRIEVNNGNVCLKENRRENVGTIDFVCQVRDQRVQISFVHSWID